MLQLIYSSCNFHCTIIHSSVGFRERTCSRSMHIYLWLPVCVRFALAWCASNCVIYSQRQVGACVSPTTHKRHDTIIIVDAQNRLGAHNLFARCLMLLSITNDDTNKYPSRYSTHTHAPFQCFDVNMHVRTAPSSLRPPTRSNSGEIRISSMSGIVGFRSGAASSTSN